MAAGIALGEIYASACLILSPEPIFTKGAAGFVPTAPFGRLRLGERVRLV